MFGAELLQASLQKCMPTILHAFCSPASPGTKSPAQPHGIGGGGGQARSLEATKGRGFETRENLLFDGGPSAVLSAADEEVVF